MEQQNSLLGTEEHPSYRQQAMKNMAILAHVLALFFGLYHHLLYLIKKDESSYVAAQAKESLNFQLTVTLACIVLAIKL